MNVDFARAASDASRQAKHSIAFEAEASFRFFRAARFRFDNGMRVVLMPDDRAPVFAYQTWFSVGSRDEEPHRTGIAHLFEHLMFKGTRNHPTGVFDREMEKRGVQTNAGTWVDWTYYTESLAVRGDNLATVIDFESDRMVNLLLDEDTFRSELEVVKNERRMSVDDSTSGLLNELLFRTVFTRHSYRWPTIGAMEHLEAMTVADLEAFYQSYYAPNNATVVIVGDLDPTETLVQLSEKYANLARQDIQRTPREKEPPQTAPREARIERPITSAQMVIAYRAPAELDPAYTPLEMLSDAIAVGESSRLYRRLVVEDKLATDVEGFLSPFAEPGLYELFVHLRKGASPDAVMEAVQQELNALQEGLTDREIEKARNDLEISMFAGLRHPESCAEVLGHCETNHQDFGVVFREADRFSRVTANQLVETARDTFAEHNRTTVVAVPETM